MKVAHTDEWISIQEGGVLNTSYNLSSYITTGEVLASAAVTAVDSLGNNTTASIIANVATSGTSVTFKVSNGVANKTYSLKITGYLNTSEVFIKYMTCEVFGTITLDTVLGGSTSNSYVTLEEANKYIRNKYGHGNTWDTLTIEGKKRVLIQAALDLNVYNFIGEKYYDSQSLAFPRDEHDIITGNCATPLTLSGFKNTSLYSTTYGVYPEDYWKYGACHITNATPLYDKRTINTSNVSTGAITVTPDFSASPTENTQFIIFAPLDANIKYAQCEQALFILDNTNIEDLLTYTSVGTKRVKIGDVEVESYEGGSTKIPVSSVAKKLLSKWIQSSILVGRA